MHLPTRRFSIPGRGWSRALTHVALAPLVAAGIMALSCGGAGEPPPLTADLPVHLEEHLDRATVVGAQVSQAAVEPRTWSFGDGGAEWHPVHYPNGAPSTARAVDGVLRIEASVPIPGDKGYLGAAFVELPDLTVEEWGELRVEARNEGARWLNLALNLGTRYVEEWGEEVPYEFLAEGSMLVRDGQLRTYRLHPEAIVPQFGEWQGDPWRQLILEVYSHQPAAVEIALAELVPKSAAYRVAGAGQRSESRQGTIRSTLYHHAPGRIEYPLVVPPAGRLDVALSALSNGAPLTFSVTAAEPGGKEHRLFEETLGTAPWQPRSIDLSPLAGRTVSLALAAEGESGGIAFWGSPIVSGEPRAAGGGRPPNVIFYVIDGGGADLMSLYGYNRRTTPNLERIAAEGAVFEHAYSNSAWTKPSTASFMTSLQQSVLGGFRSLQDPIPPDATTMAEHFHRAGYVTAVFTSNPWAGSLSGLERGVDVFRDHGPEAHSTSSRQLHSEFWEWRRHFPATPYWVHFQATDVHEPHQPIAPFSGLWVDPARRSRFDETWKKISGWSMPPVKDPAATLADFYRERLTELGTEPRDFFDTQRGLYDETMAHQDEQLGKLVARLKASGEWNDTLLVIGSDHGHPAGSFSRFGRELFDPLPASDEGALLDSYRSRVPLVFVWPGRIAAGQRLTQQVSMIDVLPTLLDLAGLPRPEVLQGQSLAPLLRGEPGWQPRPVILEQLQPVPDHDTLVGHIEVIDGRWGASLEIWPDDLDPAVARPVGHQRAARPHRPGMPSLYLYDLWRDPFALRRVNDEHPELVEKYTRLLLKHWRAHQALAQRFTAGEEATIDPAQLETLRALGYVQ
jgi:arylsulfatase A-like enzyme